MPILPADQNDYGGDDSGQKYEASECTQGDDCAKIQFCSVCLMLIILYQIWNVHIRWLIGSAMEIQAKYVNFHIHSKEINQFLTWY